MVLAKATRRVFMRRPPFFFHGEMIAKKRRDWERVNASLGGDFCTKEGRASALATLLSVLLRYPVE
jgi:hypothetical protein